jgi:hypothetical protein
VVALGAGWQEIGVRQTDCTALVPLRQAEDRQVAMNGAQERYRLPQMKASDADRDAVVAALSEHFQTGRLTREELDERTGRALTARTLDELDELTADLPGIRAAGPGPVVRPRGLGYPLLAPVTAALAVLAIAALVLGVGDGRHGWDWWWVIPAGLLFARRLAGWGGAHQDSGRN